MVKTTIAASNRTTSGVPYFRSFADRDGMGGFSVSGARSGSGCRAGAGAAAVVAAAIEWILSFSVEPPRETRAANFACYYAGKDLRMHHKMGQSWRTTPGATRNTPFGERPYVWRSLFGLDPVSP